MMRFFRALLLTCGLWLVMGAPPAHAGPAGRPDPKQMSGIPRPDPEVKPGEITVRVLRGSFDDPALGAMVTLELRSADGRLAQLRTAEAGNQGRAFFRGLDPFIGGHAVARVVLDGEAIHSRQIDLLPSAGTRVMLVKGGAKSGSATDQVSLPGIVFDFDRAPPGSLMVGTFDLKARQGLEGVEVSLIVTTPDGASTTRTATTGKQGQANFDKLAELPEGATVQVQAQLDEEGEPHRSMSFVPDPSKGQAVVLARGRMAPAGRSPHEGGASPNRKRTKLPGPKISRELPLGTVQVMVIDGNDQPVADYPLALVKKDFSGTEQRFSAKTDAEGIARVDDLPVVNDALYYVGVGYSGAPYTSPFFGLDKRGGVRVAMRVWETTSDFSVGRSAVQMELIEGENDLVQVIQVYEVLISGDKAFWTEDPLRIETIPGEVKSVTILRGAEDWLEHEEKAPYVTLSHPIPPGEPVALSIGYFAEHDGELAIDWPAPFSIVQSAIILSEKLELDVPGSKKPGRDLEARPGQDYQPVAWDLGELGAAPFRAEVRGLRRTEQLFRRIGIAGGALLGGLVLLVVGVEVLRPGRDPRARLRRRRDELLSTLEGARTAAQRRRIVAALDRTYRQLDALEAMSDEGGSRGRTKAAS